MNQRHYEKKEKMVKIIKNDHSHKNHKSVIAKRLIGVFLAIALLGSTFFAYRFIYSGPDKISFNAVFPGVKSSGFTFEAQKSAKTLKDGFQKKLVQSYGVLEYYQIAGKTGTPPAKKSENMIFENQVNLLSFYVEIKDKNSFNKLNNWIKSIFQSENGLFVKKVSTDKLEKPEGGLEVSVSEQIYYCRVLIEAYVRFGQKRDLDLVITLSKQLYPLCKDKNILPPEMSIALPEETPTPDFTATPEPKPSVMPTIDPSKIIYIGVVDLSTIDLYALKLLTSIDAGWDAVYKNCLEVISKAAIDSPAPFYQAGYDVQKAGYVPYLMQKTEFDFEQQMKILLHLAEVSQIRESSFSYLKQQLFNTKTFYQTYQILTATATTENESITGYALMARIARIRQDKELYDLCIDRIEWNTATSTDSDVYGLPFQTNADGSILAYSNDAINALKVIY